MTLTDHELAGKLVTPRMMKALNGVGQGLNKEAATRLEQRAAAYGVIAEAFKFHYYRDRMNAATHRDDVRYSPLTVLLAETLRDDETSDAEMDYGAINEVMGWVEGVPETVAS